MLSLSCRHLVCDFSYVNFYLFCFICFDYLLNGVLKTITFIESSCIFISYQCESSLFPLVFSVMHSNLSDVKYYQPCFLPFPSSHSFCSFPSSSLCISILLLFSSSVYSTLVSFYLDLLWEISTDFDYLVTNLRTFIFSWGHISHSYEYDHWYIRCYFWQHTIYFLYCCCFPFSLQIFTRLITFSFMVS